MAPEYKAAEPPTKMLETAKPQVKAVVESWQQKYNLNLQSMGPASSKALQDAISRGTPAGVRKAMFKALAEQNPAKAIELDIKAYQRKGVKISAGAASQTSLMTGKIFDRPEQALAAYQQAAKVIRADAERQARPKAPAAPAAVAAVKPAAAEKPAAGKFSPEQQAQKAWQQLNVGAVKVKLGGQETTMDQALEKIKGMEGKQKLDAFASVTRQLAENFRVQGPEAANKFGIKYSSLGTTGQTASDPSKVLERKRMDCFSGSATLSSLIAQSAIKAGMEGQVKVGVAFVSATSAGGTKWEDTGHAVAAVRIGKGEFMLDTTNAGRGGPITFKGSGLHKGAGQYYRMAEKEFDAQKIQAIGALQDRLFNSMMAGKAPSAQDVAALSKLPTSAASRLAGAMTPEQQVKFFKAYRVDKIADPVARFRMSLTAASANMRTNDQQEAMRYGAMALNSLMSAVKTGRAKDIPTATVAESVLTLAKLYGSSPSQKDQEAFMRSGVVHMVANIANSAERLDKQTAQKMYDFMKGHYAANKGLYRTLSPQVQVRVATAMVELDKHANKTENKGAGGEAGAAALKPPRAETTAMCQELYRNVGLDYNKMMASLARNHDKMNGAGAFDKLMSGAGSQHFVMSKVGEMATALVDGEAGKPMNWLVRNKKEDLMVMQNPLDRVQVSIMYTFGDRGAGIVKEGSVAARKLDEALETAGINENVLKQNFG